jgi:hypothetical protein
MITYGNGAGHPAVRRDTVVLANPPSTRKAGPRSRSNPGARGCNSATPLAPPSWSSAPARCNAAATSATGRARRCPSHPLCLAQVAAPILALWAVRSGKRTARDLREAAAHVAQRVLSTSPLLHGALERRGPRRKERDKLPVIVEIPLAGGPPTTLASGQRSPSGITVRGSTVYWTDWATFIAPQTDAALNVLMTVPIAGGSPTTLLSGQSSPTDIAVDYQRLVDEPVRDRDADALGGRDAARARLEPSVSAERRRRPHQRLLDEPRQGRRSQQLADGDAVPIGGGATTRCSPRVRERPRGRSPSVQ